MPTDISEKELETILVSYLRDHQGYEEGVSSDYNKEFGIPAILATWIPKECALPPLSSLRRKMTLLSTSLTDTL